MNFWIFENLKIWIFKNMNLWIFENLKIWKFEFLKIWKFKNLNFWICVFCLVFLYESSARFVTKTANIFSIFLLRTQFPDINERRAPRRQSFFASFKRYRQWESVSCVLSTQYNPPAGLPTYRSGKPIVKGNEISHISCNVYFQS